MLVACSGSKPGSATVAAEDCTAVLSHSILASETCAEAQLRADTLLSMYPACRGIFGDAGLDVCAKMRDGGHGDR
jgi:hypothetical protein